MKRPNEWLKSLSITKKVLLSLALLLVGVGVIGSQQPTANLNSTNSANLAQAQLSPKPKAPTITTQTVTEPQSIPFTSTTIQSPALAKGITKITTAGVDGSQTFTYQVTYTDGQQTDKKLTNTTVTLQPVTQVTSVGTYVAPAPAPAAKSNCDPNYSGACVPNVYPSDVDCAGGSGNGPYYVQGPVRVIGSDIYGLDRDGNGIGCE